MFSTQDGNQNHHIGDDKWVVVDSNNKISPLVEEEAQFQNTSGPGTNNNTVMCHGGARNQK
jgi:hypothetical protein